MAITSHFLHPSSMTGEASTDGRKYHVAWVLQSDDVDDGAQVCIDYVTRNIADVGAPYRVGNDSDRGSALKSIKPMRDGDRSRKVWLVHCNYEPLKGGSKESKLGEDGKPTSDPLAWYDRVSIREARVMRPIEQAVYHGGRVGMAAQQRRPGSLGAVVNSANVPYDPPLEEAFTTEIITITKNIAEFPQPTADLLRDSVNSRDVPVVKQFARYVATWKTLTAKVESLTGEFRFENDIAYWECSLVIALDPRTFRRFVLDRGLHASFAQGFPDPDDENEVITFGDRRIRENHPQVRRLVDHEDRTITEVVRFDGNGQPLANDKPDVYLEYGTIREVDWFPLLALGFLS